MSRSDDRHEQKLKRRAASRARAEARQATRIERDRKLRALADKYLADVRQIWADWRQA